MTSILLGRPEHNGLSLCDSKYAMQARVSRGRREQAHLACPTIHLTGNGSQAEWQPSDGSGRRGMTPGLLEHGETTLDGSFGIPMFNTTHGSDFMMSKLSAGLDVVYIVIE